MILVLNADYTPLTVTNLFRGFNLVYKGKAEIVVKDDKPISADKKYDRPSVIRLFRYINIPRKKLTLSRYNVYRRDSFKCQYCGSKEKLTLDHVIPRSKGGPNSWTNLVTCCMKCNIKKGDRLIEEAGMILNQKPFTPNHLFFIRKMNNIYEDWQPFLMLDK